MLFLSLLTLPLAFAFNISKDANVRQESGYVAYHIKQENYYTDSTLISLSMILSTIFPTYMSGMSGFLFSSVIGLGGFSYALRNSYEEPQTAYQLLWGKIETHINNRINSESSAKLRDQLRTLSISLQDHLDGYMAELGASSPSQMVELKDGFNISATTVDSYMKSIDNLLSASTQFSSFTPVDSANPEYFVLVDAGMLGKKRCLHTASAKIDDGALVVLDEECDLNSLSDKLWSLDATERLVLRTAAGDKCLSYVTKTWSLSSSLKNPIAVYDLNTKQCSKGRAIKLKQRPDFTWSLYDGSRMICAQPSKTKRSNFLVTREKGNKCIGNNTLSFKSRIPVPMTNARGVLVPAMGLEEIFVQMYYMPTIANLHLASLKEMYNHGTQTIFAAVQFNSKVKEYSNFLNSNLPIFAEYALFKGFKALDQIKAGLLFADQLQNATLAFSPTTIMFPRQKE